MSKQIIEWLSPQPGEIFVDCTVGEGGHAFQICECLKGRGKFVGIDQDKEAVNQAQVSLREFNGLVNLVCDNFKNLDNILDGLGVGLVNGIFFDLGVSAGQLGKPERGFSFQQDGPLDMRMDQSQDMTASDIVNNLPAEELAHILRNFGQERWAWRIAKAIVQDRKNDAVTTTRQLVEIILKVVPNRINRARIHPATRTFQALRIAVNNELEILRVGLEKSLSRLASGGRIGVISFHSLEDRIVKNTFRNNLIDNKLVLFTPKPIRPDIEEIRFNPRCRSARFRAAQKKGETPGGV